MAATARGAASPSPASPSLPRRDSAVIRLFQAKLRANATDRVSKRLTSLEQLSIITNSKEFREATNECGEELSTRLSSMMDESNNISLSMSDISYVKRLGEGGFAYCDLYERKLLNGKSMFYALKVLKEELHIPSVDPLSNPARVAYLPESEKIKFISEALVLTSLRHKHLVGCYGCLREEKKEGKGLPAPKLLLEYCPGGTLLDQLQQRKYLVDDAFRWLLQISMGMSYLHATGCIHRDLKPENVLLKNGEAKVADFGLFRMKLSSSAIHNPHQPQSMDPVPIAPRRFSTGSSNKSEKRLGRSFSGKALAAKYPSMVMSFPTSNKDCTQMTGTPRYMAPELHELTSPEDVKFTNKVDVYSFAILACEMLSRSRAFSHLEALSMDQICKQVATKGLRPYLPKSWTPELRAFLERIWAQDPKERPTFAEITAQLGEMIEKGKSSEEGLANHYGLKEYQKIDCSCALM